MKYIDAYILRTFFRIYLLTLAAFAGVYLLIDFFEKIDNFIEHQAEIIYYIAYFGCKLPLIASQMSPLALLMASFMTIGGFAQHQELTAMHAGGISLTRIARPMIYISLLLVLTTLLINEFIIPIANRQLNYIYQVEVKGKSLEDGNLEDLWYRDQDKMVHIALIHPSKEVIEGIELIHLDDQFKIVERIDTHRATYQKGGWLAEKPLRRIFTNPDALCGEFSTPNDLLLDIGRTPKDFSSEIKRTDELGFLELYHLTRKLKKQGFDSRHLEVDMHSRLAIPFASLIMILLGIPFALKKGRGSNLALGIAVCVAIGISYHILQSILISFGYTATLSPFSAAWGANILFTFFGFWLLNSTRF